MPKANPTDLVADLIHDAGGKVVGRTRLQKIAFLLELVGLGAGFSFAYRHYGPFSEELADASRNAVLLDVVQEQEKETNWGGFYSVYSVAQDDNRAVDPRRLSFARLASEADAVVLELAATAAFLASEFADPWAETAKRKPQKAHGRMDKAKEFYASLRKLDVPNPLPEIV